MYWISALRHQVGVLLALFTVTAFLSLLLGQTEIKAIEVLPCTFNDLQTFLKSCCAEAKAVVVFFVRVNASTQSQGNELANYLEKEYNSKWKKIPAKVLIVAHGDREIIQQAMREVPLPVLHDTDGEMLGKYDVVASYALYVIICAEEGTGIIVARFDNPEDIGSKKPDLAVKGCTLSDYLVKAPFDNRRKTSVLEKPDKTPVNGSDITSRGETNYEFEEGRCVSGQGASIKINFSDRGEGSFGIELAGMDLSRATYLSLWVLGEEGAEQFHIVVKNANGEVSHLPVTDYVHVSQSQWQRIVIPLTDFNLDLREVSSVSLRSQGSQSATIYIDDLTFYGGAMISGTVTYRANGHPVHGAVVTTDPETTTVTSDASGRYEIANISPGRYKVLAVQGEKRGSEFVTIKSGQHEAANNIQIDGKISICIMEAPEAGVFPRTGVIKGIVKGLSANDMEKHKVVIYSETNLFYVQPWEADPYTSIDGDSEWSAEIYLGNKSYTAYLIKIREPLFSINPRFQANLAERVMSENLRREFADKVNSLPQNISISSPRGKEYERWLITDPRAVDAPLVQGYLVRREGDQLNVYHAWPSCVPSLPDPDDIDGVEIIDKDAVEPNFRRENCD